MKKHVLAMVAVSLFAGTASSALAANKDKNQWFIGVDGANQLEAFKRDATRDEQKTGYSLNFGKHLGDNDQHRLSFTYGQDDWGRRNGKNRERDALASYDYMLPLNQTGTIKWFAGATAGVSEQDIKGQKNNYGPTLGAQTGFAFDVHRNVGLEAGYKYRFRMDDNFKQRADQRGQDDQLYLGAKIKFGG